MHASTGTGALGAMAAFLQHSPRQRSYADLTDAEVEEIGRTLDALREEVLADRGARDAAYIRRVIAVQRCLEVAGRVVLLGSRSRTAWWLGTASLTLSKVLDNMEIGHNVLHGQWDWMRDPRDPLLDVGLGPRVGARAVEARPQRPAPREHQRARQGQRPRLRHPARRRGAGVAPRHLVQPLLNLLNAFFFEYGIATYDLDLGESLRAARLLVGAEGGDAHDGAPGRAQRAADYVLHPLLSAPTGSARTTLTANPAANLARNVWSHSVIMCGHFPEGVETFEVAELDEHETRGRWYVRQMLGSADVSGPPLLHVLCGNLSHQIEHHLFPDLPSNRYREIAGPVRELFERHGLPTTPRRCGGRSPAPGRRSSGCRCRPDADRQRMTRCRRGTCAP